MALSIINVCRVSKDQDFINVLKRRLLSIARIHSNSPANRPTLSLAKTKTVRLPPDCISGPNRIFPNHLKTIYHLAKRSFNCTATMSARNFGKKGDPTISSDLQAYKDSNYEDYGGGKTVENQVARLKQKGAMKDMQRKVPEAIVGLKGHGEKGN